MTEQNKECNNTIMRNMSNACMYKNNFVSTKELGGETILYNPDTKKVHILNATALLIWQLCDGHHALEQIVENLIEKFFQRVDKRDEKNIEQDVRSILNDFRVEGLIH